MSIDDLPAIMGTVLIVAGLALAERFRMAPCRGEWKGHSGRGAHHCGRGIPLGAVDIRVTWKIGPGPRAIQVRTLPIVLLCPAHTPGIGFHVLGRACKAGRREPHLEGKRFARRPISIEPPQAG